MARLAKSSTKNRSSQLAAIKRKRTARLTRVAARATLLQRRGKLDEAYTLVCNEFMSLGGIYVKFLQGVLLNSPIMKRWHNAEKFKIFEGLDPEPLDIVALLNKWLRADQLQQIARLQTEPFASGSFGQVYYGELQNGQPIIIKALRPQVRELLLHDLRLLTLFSRFFVGRHYQNFDMKLSDAIRDFRQATLAETDYVQEAEFANQMYQAQANNPDVVIPRTYLDLCTPELIVQDYVAGISCADLLEKKVTQGIDPETYVREQLGSDLSLQLETLGTAMLGDCFTQPRVMGDPHPGNIRLLADNKVGLIDFGISAPAPRDRPAFFGLIREWSHMYKGTLNIANLFEQFLRVFMNDLYRAFKKLTSLLPAQSNESAEQNMMRNVGGVINELFEGEEKTDDVIEAMDQGRLLRIFGQVINKGNRLGLLIKLHDTEILRAAQTYMSTVEALGLRSEVLSVVFNTVVEQQAANVASIANYSERPLSTSQALEIVNSWLERIASKDPSLFRRMLQQVAQAGYGTVKVAAGPEIVAEVPEKEEQAEEQTDA